ncbi:RecQ family ATP-dependent DNA helicase [Cupriavidus pauculus]|uniref:ATP-dependent DNA helicase RecQ n=1 Tax=Cupriavidus pauculus TaxID=82633 RepID=A0A3G8H6B8_9BURK|nr:RecQ family ATP-dependent DNA helicase [Cupriavidus pauculus]AZG15640.1 ATP-dependent DNA helicase RecQ [Cupriavidus pauculus]
MTLTLPAALMRILEDRFGVTRLRPGQADVLRSVLDGRDTIAVMPTGSGKSLCFQLPALVSDGLTVVVSPLIALMQDQATKLGNLELAPAVLNSAVGDAALADLARRRERILLTTPEQLEDPEVVDTLRRNRVALFVVDEAHCISQWGHDFRPAYLGLRDAAKALSRPPLLALTATATDAVIQDIVQELGMRQPRIVRAPLYRPNLHYAVEHVSGDAGQLDAVRRLVGREAGQGGAGIVYTATVAMAEQLHGLLREAGVEAALYHGRRTAAQRRAAQDAFMTGQAAVMVATNAFGMGIDKPDVRFIVHAQSPGSLDAYYQESGRAGRDGAPARCTLVFDERDRRIHQFFLAGRYPAATDLHRMALAVQDAPLALPALATALPDIGVRRLQVGMRMLRDFGIVARDRAGRFALRDPAAAGVDVIAARYAARSREDHATLQAMLDYARSGGCRWATLLAYYSEAFAQARCGTCDSCRRMDELAQPAAAAPPAPEKRPASTPVTGPAFATGDAVRARRFGAGVVNAVSDEWVEVRFPDDSVRRFLPHFLRAVAAERRRAA